MRQAGIVAAGALYALDHHVERLADDHALAATLARELAEVPGVALDPAAVATNIVVFEVADAPALVAALADAGVKMGALGPRRCGPSPTSTSTRRARRGRSTRSAPPSPRLESAVPRPEAEEVRTQRPWRERRIASATRSALSGARSAARRRCLALGPTSSSTSAASSGGAAR